MAFKSTYNKAELTVKELFARLERDLHLGRDNAGEVIDITFENLDGDPEYCGVASFEWDGLHFLGVDANDTLMHYQNATALWTLQDLI